MAENSSTAPGMASSNTYTGTAGNDTFTAGGGNDVINAGTGEDRIAGDGPLAGQWTYSVYTRDFTSASNQTGTISSGTLRGTGYVDDFNVLALRNTLAGTAQGTNQDDFGVIYQSTLNIATTGTYTFGVTSDDGSRIIIRDASGNIVFNLDNDREQSATTANGSVTLQAGQTYSIELYYWENQWDTAFSATIAGPGFNQTPLSTSPLVGTPPTAAGHVDGSDTLYGDGGSDTVLAGGGNDSVYGGTESDSVLGEAGNDQLYGDAGLDTLYGGTGDDTLFGGTESDRLWGDDGNDLLYGDAGYDTLFGGVGDDRLFGGLESDSLSGGDGNDQLYGEAGLDTLTGGLGEDTLYGGVEADSLTGDDGNDRLYGDDGLDTLFGGAGDDTLSGGGDADSLNGGLGNDLTYGDAGIDTISAGGGEDTVYGGGDADSILGEDGNDRLYGDAGVDTLVGGLGNDQLYGGTEADSLTGDAGNDLIDGGAGTDTISGGDGNDTIFAGSEDDTVYGGAGTDSIFGGEGRDYILYGTGDDTIYAGGGDDYVDDIEGQRFAGRNLVDAGDGQDRVYTGLDADTVYGGAGHDTIDGEEGDDQIYGGSGADMLSGDEGRDTFYMQGGDFAWGDRVDGGGGADDYDTLDLSGYGWARTDIVYSASDSESGTVTFYDPNGAFLGTMEFTEIERVIPCFAAGTLIDTPTGPRAVESLRPGDLVLTLDDGPQTVRWVGQRRLGLADLLADPSLQPVEIAADAFGAGVPVRTIQVSPQHRVLFGGAICELYFGAEEVLVPAIQLVGQRGVSQRLQPVTYVHVMFDRHQIVQTHGLWSESYQPGERTLEGMPDPQREELLRLFPDLSAPGSYPAARMTLKAFETRVLLQS
jgi:Ca2+-binding RTX toxin-like protein